MGRPVAKLNLPKVKTLMQEYSSWAYGENRLLSANSIRRDELSEATNCFAYEKGSPGPRWGFSQYGGDGISDASVVRLVTRYDKDGTNELLKFVDNGSAIVLYTKDGDTWTEIADKTWTTGSKIGTINADGNIWIVGSADNLCYYDGSTVTEYTQIDTPDWAATPLVKGAGLQVGANYVYYKITAINNQSNTEANTEVSLAVDITPELWDKADEYIDLDWDASTDATGYEIYRSTQPGLEEYVTTVYGNTNTSFRDYAGTVYPTTPSLGAPTENSTGGVKGTMIELHKDSLLISGDADNPSRLYYSGGGDRIGYFNYNNGGGFVDIARNSRTGAIRAIREFTGKDGVLVEKQRAKYMFSFTETDLPSVINITTAAGGASHESLRAMENDMVSMGEEMYVTGDEPQFLNVIRSNSISTRERPRISEINRMYEDGMTAQYFGGKYWLFYPEGASTKNNAGLVYDRERVGFWYINKFKGGTVTINCTEISHDANGNAIFLFGDGESDTVFEWTENATTDDGEIIDWQFTTKAEDYEMATTYKISIINKLLFKNVYGSINVEIIADGDSTVKSVPIKVGANASGFGVDMIGVDMIGYGSDVEEDILSQMVIKRDLRLSGNKKFLNIKFRVSNTSGVFAGMRLLNMTLYAIPLGFLYRKAGEKI